MDKIIFKVGKNLLTIDKYTKDIKVDLNNTNVIDTKEIIFSIDYIKNNLELVSSFLNVIIIKQNIKKTIIKDYDIILNSLDVLSHIPNIKDIEPMSYCLDEMECCLNDDKAEETVPIEELLRNSGKTVGREVEVVKVVGENV